MKCKICGTKFEPKLFLQKHCNNDICKDKWRKLVLEEKKQLDNNFISKYRPIKKVSDKKALQDIIYKSERIKFLMLPENKICPITKQATTDVHHKRGRLGDLYLDKRYWVALSREGHKYVEEHPEWAKENGYSLSRLSNE